MAQLVFGLFLLFFPMCIIWLCDKVAFLNKIGAVTLGFVCGIGLSLAGALPFTAFEQAQTSMLNISIALALPLLVFSVDVRQSFKMARQLLLPMGLAIASVVIITTLLTIIANYWFYEVWQGKLWQYAGMAVGAYTGGGVNMAAIKTAINAHESVFIVMTSYDILLSSLYLLLLLTIGVPFVRAVLPTYVSLQTNLQTNLHSNVTNSTHATRALGVLPQQQSVNNMVLQQSAVHANSYKKLLEPSSQKFNLVSLLLAGSIVGVSVLMAELFAQHIQATLTIIFISSLAILASMVKQINQLPNSYQLGMYLVVVFCFTVGSMFDMAILSALNVHLFVFLLLLVFASFILHILLCKLFNIDADRCLITSVASIMSLPFMPLICSRLNNQQMLVAGIAVAIIGYILGTYLGIATAFVLM